MDLRPLFDPQSVAIIGVSHDRRKVGYLVAANMIHQGYAGSLYFVNPKGGTVLGRELYPSVLALPEDVDLAVLAVPAGVAVSILDELKHKKIRYAVLFAAGFSEIGEEGRERHEALVKKCNDYGITLLGPNCLGFVNTGMGINATFLKHTVPPGNIGFISQSGALGSVLVDEFISRKKLGISYFVSLGNKTIIDEADVIEFLADDPSTHVIGMYLEDVRNGKKFERVLKKATLKKPVIILKSGASEEGSKAALSHTGGLAGDDRIFTTLFAQCGAIRADSYSEFMVLLTLFSYGKVPVGRDILVLSNAGGCGVLLADSLVAEGLHLVTISESVKQQLSAVFGASRKISVHNPIDILGDASAYDYEKAAMLTLSDREIGAVIVLLTPQANTEIAETAKVIARAQDRFDRPIYPVFMGRDSVTVAHDYFASRSMASFRSFDVLIPALAKAVWFREYLAQNAGRVEYYRNPVFPHTTRRAIEKLISRNARLSVMPLDDSLEVARLVGIPVSPVSVVNSVDELKSVLKEFGYPVTLKIVSKTITHKTDVKGVYTGLTTMRQAESACEAILAIPGASGVAVQRQVHGYEVILGAKRDPNFGTILLVGMGGIAAELYQDTAVRIFPFSRVEFLRMLAETRLYRLLTGFRGQPPADLGALYDAVYAAGLLMERFPAIMEFDGNPLFVSAEGVTLVDARIVIS
ncbi:MAG: acetate--CoA ligase family protein [Patescibacteria group bacterium]|nr:acetate--CoA ligase family protein [Patescibacteria group bacterium]